MSPPASSAGFNLWVFIFHSYHLSLLIIPSKNPKLGAFVRTFKNYCHIFGEGKESEDATATSDTDSSMLIGAAQNMKPQIHLRLTSLPTYHPTRCWQSSKYTDSNRRSTSGAWILHRSHHLFGSCRKYGLPADSETDDYRHTESLGFCCFPFERGGNHVSELRITRHIL
jgi:hypothetical protein